MAHIEIWMEGFAVTGQQQDAQKIWEGEANDFDDAILKLEEQQVLEYGKSSVDRYKATQATRSKYGIWACRLFDNEKEARESFG